jgi:hypothetical protein
LFKKKSVIQVGIIADETVKCLEDAYKWRQICIQPVPELPPHRKQACADSKRDSKMIKINFPVAHIKFSISPIPEAYPQVLGTKKSDRLLDSKNNY